MKKLKCIHCRRDNIETGDSEIPYCPTCGQNFCPSCVKKGKRFIIDVDDKKLYCLCGWKFLFSKELKKSPELDGRVRGVAWGTIKEKRGERLAGSYA